MRVAIEIQPVLEKKMTGVGWYTDNIVRRIKRFAGENDRFYLVGMDFFNKANEIKEYSGPNVFLRTNGLIHYGIYRRLWRFLPFLDYGTFFNTRADIFHFFNFVAPPNVKGKIIITVYDMVYKVFPETMQPANYQKLDKNLKRSCDAAEVIVTISQNSKREIMEHLDIDGGKIHIIPPAVDLDLYRPDYDPREVARVTRKYRLPDKYFLYLGTIEPRKNIESIIEAFRILLNRHGSNYNLVIAGMKGWMFERVFELVDKYGLQDRVVFPGYVEERDKPFIYSGARAFIFPSLYEGFGMPPLESMACGTPVITSDSSSLPEVVGDAGIMVSALDVEGISQGMYRISQDDALHAQLREKGIERAKSFSWDQSTQKLIKLYRFLGG